MNQNKNWLQNKNCSCNRGCPLHCPAQSNNNDGQLTTSGSINLNYRYNQNSLLTKSLESNPFNQSNLNCNKNEQNYPQHLKSVSNLPKTNDFEINEQHENYTSKPHFVEKTKLCVPKAAQSYKIICNKPIANISSASNPIYSQSFGITNNNSLINSSKQNKTLTLTNDKSNVFSKWTSGWFSTKNEEKIKKQHLPEYNVLLLGGTGTGKSTTINAYANYVKFASIGEAQKQKNFVELISSFFKLSHPDTDEEFCIKSGFDSNEFDTGNSQSRTKMPMAYKFMFKDKVIRLIDTPGIGDTNGLMADRINFENILKYLKNYNTLHGIIILIKANETRDLTVFRYCITELFKRLHRSASENVFFCFTFSRTTFYKPGDGLQIMNNLLKEEFPDAQLALKSKVNCFFIDNEAYRYLVAKKEGYPFKNYQLKTFTEAWNISSAQTNDMLQRIIETTPHNLKTTFWLNMAQNFIIKLADPIVQLQRTIFANINTIKHQKECIESGNSTIDFLIKTINMKVSEQEFVNLEKPMTVCVSKNCPKSKNLERKQKVKNFTLCCKDCHVQYVNEKEKGNSFFLKYKFNVKTKTKFLNFVGAKLLKDCIIFKNNNNKFLKNCNKCGCSFKEHMQLHRVQMAVEKEVVNPAKLKELNELLKSKEKDDNLSQRIIDVLQANIKEREEEMQTIQWVASQFGYLLNKHSNSVYIFVNIFLKLFLVS